MAKQLLDNGYCLYKKFYSEQVPEAYNEPKTLRQCLEFAIDKAKAELFGFFWKMVL